MPDYRTDTAHFSPLGELTVADRNTAIVDVLKATAAKGISGVIVYDKDKPRWYLDGNKLSKVALTVGSEDQSFFMTPLADAIATHAESIEPMDFSAVVANVDPAESVGSIPLGDEAPEYAIYPVQLLGVTIGALFSNESFKASATVPAHKYYCTNPDGKHENQEPDHGFCGHCPWPLEK
ncbi:MAG TPA: hypothetical protein VGJ81_05440 [Thermoanaerobaculia bacterium]|jgi:hypothetical protein